MTVENSYGENLVNARLSNLVGYNTYEDNQFRLTNKSLSSWSFDGEIPVEMEYVLLWNKDTASFNVKPGQHIIITDDEDNPVVYPVIKIDYPEEFLFYNNVVTGGETGVGEFSITNITGNGTVVTIFADNNLAVGNIVSINSVSPISYNLSNVEVISATSTSFKILSSITDTYVNGGNVLVEKAFNTNIFITYLDENNIEQVREIDVVFDADGYPRNQIYVVTEKWENRNIGTSGWIITSGGNSIFNNVAVRGEIDATSGNFDGHLTVNNGLMKIGSGVSNLKDYEVSSFEILNNEVILTIGSHTVDIGDTIVVSNIGSFEAMSPEFPEDLTVTNIVGNESQVTYTATNSLIPGTRVTIIDAVPEEYNLSFVEVVSATSTDFTVDSSVVAAYISGGTVIVNSIPSNAVDINGTHTVSSITNTTISYPIVSDDFSQSSILEGNVSSIETNDGIYINDSNYWYSDGELSIGNANNSITFDGTDVVIGADVTINATVAADSLIVGIDPSIMTISDDSNGLGDAGLYINADNHWYTDGHFKVGNTINYVEWEGSALTIKGTLNDLELSRGGGNIATNFAVGINALENNTIGENNIALGQDSLFNNTTGSTNISIGYQSLYSNTVGYQNVSIGAGSLYNSDASFNVSIGYNAMKNNITGYENIAIGSYANADAIFSVRNTAIGNKALASNYTGSNNVAIGASALSHNYTGRFNVAIGDLSMTFNGIGENNVAIGTETLHQNGSGFSNVALGYRALFDNRSGSLNLAVGSNSLFSNQTGEKNISIGAAALYKSFSGSNNVAIGTNALYDNLIDNNIAIGSFALQSNTTGESNLAIGYQALYYNVTGSLNTAIGESALFLNTGSNNLAIGSSAMVFNTTGQYNIAIGANSLYLNTTGNLNVAIGRSSLAFNQSGIENIGIGSYANAANVSGSRNIAIGTNSLYSNTVSENFGIGAYSLYSNITGLYNLGIGYNSLYFNNASYNTAIGSLSLYSNTEGAFNTAIGYESMVSNTTGYQNLSIGMQSLRSNISGNDNVAIGPFSLYSNITGSNNIAIGSNALSSNKSVSNTAIGSSALSSNISGNYNTAIGSGSLNRNINGQYNTAIGQWSLFENLSSRNTAIGYYTLGYNTTGSENLAIGFQALNSNVTGSANLAIGNNALAKNTSGLSNMAIGNGSMYLTTTGKYNVGIGQNSLYSNNSDYNVAIGYQALQSNSIFGENVAIGSFALNKNTGALNVAIGSGALQNHQFNNEHVAIGAGALNADISGASSVAIGTYALGGTTRAASNTAIGAYALYNSSSNLNTAVGSYAGYNVTTGGWNTYLGGFTGTGYATANNHIFISDGSGNVRIRSDNNGGVTMPSNPLFSATDTRALDITNAVLTSANCYNQVDYNVGNCFNASTGRFTAKTSGYYEASAHFGSIVSNTINVRIRKNGVSNSGPLVEIYNQAGTGSTNNYARALIYLAANDYIDFEAARLTTIGGVQHMRFLVRLVQ